MVLARDLKEKIQNMQIQIEGSKRVASIEQELEGVKDAMELFISKFNQAQKEEKDIEEEGQALVEEHEEQEREEVENYENEQDSEEEDSEEEEEDDLDGGYGTHGQNVREASEKTDLQIEEEEEEDEEEDEEEEEEDILPDQTEEEYQESIESKLEDIFVEPQFRKDLKDLAGYNEAKEKLITANNIKKYKDYPSTWYEDIDRDLPTNKLIKRLVYVCQKGYSHEQRIVYLEVKSRDYEKSKSLSVILEKLLLTHKQLVKRQFPAQVKLYNYSVGNTLFQFKVRRQYFIHNIIQHFQKLTKLKEKRFN